MAPFVSERRLMTPSGQRGVETFERQLADGRWLQVTELKTKDGGMVSVGSDITQIKQHQEKLVDSERRLIGCEPGQELRQLRPGGMIADAEHQSSHRDRGADAGHGAFVRRQEVAGGIEEPFAGRR